MRDWASKQTADWWRRADKAYQTRQTNEPSREYFLNHFNFDSVLEVGSGTGRLINALPGRRGAVDINPHLLELVDEKVVKYNVDISKKLIPIDHYDLVFTFQVMQHLDHESFIRALANIKSIATKEIWLIEGQVPGYEDGGMTHSTGSYHHDYSKYLDCYQIDELHGGKIKVFRARV